MISAEGKRLAGTFGLTVNAQNGVFFGTVGGYSVAVAENTSQQKYYITFPARPSQGAPDQAPGDFLHSFAAGRKDLAGVAAQEYSLHIAVQMRGYKKVAETFHAVFQAVTGYLTENRFVSCCSHCGETQETGLYVYGNTCRTLCPDCAVKAEAAYQEAEARQAQEKSSLPLGLLGAFLGSLIGAAVWVAVYQLGYIAGAIGLLLVFCAMTGYRKLGGCLDKKGVIATVILSVVMVFVSLYLCYGVALYRGMDKAYNIFECLLAVPAFLSSSGLTGSFAAELFTGYGFMAVASVGMIAQAFRAAGPGPAFTRIG